MSDEQPAKKKKNIVWRLIKISLILGVILFILLTVLARLGGNNPIIQGALEDLLTLQSGYDARITTLNKMTFFPYISVDVEDVNFYKMPEAQPVEEIAQDEDTPSSQAGPALAQSPQKLPPIGAPLMTLSKAQIAMGFFDLMMGKSQIRHFDVKGFQAEAGTILEQSMVIERAVLRPLEESDMQGQAVLDVQGVIGKTALHAELDFKLDGTKRRKIYSVDNERSFKATLGDIQASGRVDDKVLGGVHLSEFIIEYKAQPALTADLMLENHDLGDWSVQGDIKITEHGSTLRPDLRIKLGQPLNLTGSLVSDALYIEDIAVVQGIIAAVETIIGSGASGPEPLELSQKNINLDIDIKALHKAGMLLGSLKAPLSVADAKLKLGPLSGEIIDGALTGDITLTSAQMPAKLKADVRVEKLNYGALQEANQKVSGRGDLVIDLAAKGKTIDALTTDLNGNISFVAGQGEMHTDILNLWGGGLVKALLPNFSPEENAVVNCAVMDFEIQNKMAKAKALFLDAKRVRINGEGVYDIAQDQLDLKLTPKTKDVSIGDVAPGVIVSGSLSNPSITPSALDVTKKIGGLLLGAVNPAFLAVSLIDLNLGDEHPCKAFVIETQTLAPPEKSPEGAIKPQEESLNQ